MNLNFLFVKNYLFISRQSQRERKKEIEYIIHWFTPQMSRIATPEAGQKLGAYTVSLMGDGAHVLGPFFATLPAELARNYGKWSSWDSYQCPCGMPVSR